MKTVAAGLDACRVVLLIAGIASPVLGAQRKIDVQASADKVGKYEKVEFQIQLDSHYDNPFDPAEVDLALLLTTPGGEQLSLPAFYCQDYQRRQMGNGRNRANWFYPLGSGGWKARFAPAEVGTYQAVVRLKDRTGTTQSGVVRFDCTASPRKGFIHTSRKDPRFFEFSEGDPFIAIGQNVAFIGEGQYVNLTKAEEIFAKMSQNGANFARIWTCCEDWAMAIEARKSAWGRSWHWQPPIVTVPESEGDAEGRKCVKIAGSAGQSLGVSPSHNVALLPQTRYVISGRIKSDGPAGLEIQVGNHSMEGVAAAGMDRWSEFRREFSTGAEERWPGRMSLRLSGNGTVYLEGLSLEEAGGGAELLWEADVNRSPRGVYNPLDCFMLDQVVESAEKNGIYLMLCLITRDLYMKALSDDGSPEYGEAIEDAKKLMRYAVARWGYSTSVAAWEYFNEINPGQPTDRFYAEVGRYLETIDVYGHLRTTSTWSPSAKDCRHGQLDVGQVHHYMRLGTQEDYKDEVAVVIDRGRFLRQHAPNKPVLIGEFGLATEKWGLSDHMQRDAESVHFHASLWASAFSGASGTALFWWWDQLDRQDAYRHYRPLATFLSDVSFAGLQHVSTTIGGDRVRVLGYRGNDRAYLWLADSRATWWNLVEQKQTPEPIEGTELEISGLAPGEYRVQWWDTNEGKIIQQQSHDVSQSPLRLKAPSFSRDTACKVVRSGGTP